MNVNSLTDCVLMIKVVITNCKIVNVENILAKEDMINLVTLNLFLCYDSCFVLEVDPADMCHPCTHYLLQSM